MFNIVGKTDVLTGKYICLGKVSLQKNYSHLITLNYFIDWTQ